MSQASTFALAASASVSGWAAAESMASSMAFSTWALRPAASARARRCLLRASLEGVTAAPMT